MTIRHGAEKALSLLWKLPRVSLGNIRDNPKANMPSQRGRGRYGGKTHGCGTKGSGQRQGFVRIGFEGGNTPFYLQIPQEKYYRQHHLRKEYLPVSLQMLQLMIDLGRLDITKPIDVTALCNTYLVKIRPLERQFGFQLTDEGMDCFKAKVNIEVQWAPEQVIAAVEKHGGTITTAFYDMQSLLMAMDPLSSLKKGMPIPRRMLPSQDMVGYYTDPRSRGYLADPEEIAKERFVLAQKYGYELPDLRKDPDKDMLLERKDPRQVFFGLEPGWIVNLRDKCILKPKDENLKQYYGS